MMQIRLKMEIKKQKRTSNKKTARHNVPKKANLYVAGDLILIRK